ncbi:hypothetical protein [Gorillibacterium sp. sgz500922]|uniref:hypothetical protein n=1 Tax=Gorillibacterium sp. sgz500922 TaxID=3446694 RepID=UPI003F66C60E
MDHNVNKDSLFHNKGGIALPLQDFIVAKGRTNNAQADNVWAFADDKRVILIGMEILSSPFAPPNGFTSKQVGERKVDVKSKNGKGLLFYKDGTTLIWVGGIATEKELLDLADSLPDPKTPSFPGLN